MSLAEFQVFRRQQSLCGNGTFESGNIQSSQWFFYWEGRNQGNGQVCDNNYSFGVQISGDNMINSGEFYGSYQFCPAEQVHHQIQRIGADDHFSTLPKVSPYPNGNTKSFRLGNAHNNFGLETISKKIQITQATPFLELVMP